MPGPQARHRGAPDEARMSAITIRQLVPRDIRSGARLLAASMRDNPLHQAVFGGDGRRVEDLAARAFERLMPRLMVHGQILGAFEDEDGTLVGHAGLVPSHHCQPRLHEQLAAAAVFARGGAWRSLPRMARVVRTWARLDPRDEHWHLGPAAVERGRQREGIGTRLMGAVCAELDRHGAAGYLETDKPGNVRLYRRGGFEVVATCRVLGVANWFMLRRPVLLAPRR